MPSIEGDLDRLVLYLRAYKYVINDPENKTLYPPDVRSKDELEQKIKTLFISLMGSSAAIREQEEAKARIKKEEIDAELKRAIKEIINEGVGGDYQRQIKNELITLRGLLTQTSKSEEIKSELRALRETVNTKALSSERIKKLIVPYIKKGENMESAQGENMEDKKEVYITYPAKGGKRTIGVGTLEIDFLTGQVTPPDGSTEHTSLRLDAFGFEKARSISIDTTKSVTLSLDDGGKYEIEAHQLFGVGDRNFRIAYIETTETTEIKIWASTSLRGAINIVQSTTIDTDERRFTTRIEYNASNNPIYVGEAETGSGESDEKWRIKKLTYSGSNVTQIDWCEGSEGFKYKWSERTSYSYS
jgi:hypothetical protein